eukprot:TRINITY_DN5456_c0_g1_i3.p1 TRINITY_DN5456_c0_g1~~TRINITY_DN5456_c0_g1_i3.p1  ORF type:complete len:557 (+),score=213.90 TRINITY_DN5456_c0_g1_i3:150-1673(+)
MVDVNEVIYQRYATEVCGRLGFEEFSRLVKETGVEAYTSEQEIRKLFERIDKDKNGYIDTNEFLSWWPQIHHKYLDSTSPMAAYDVLVAAEEVRPDPAQVEALKHFQVLHQQIVAHVEKNVGGNVDAGASGGGFFSSLFGGGGSGASMSDIKGLYVYGGVGCGKSFMMDLFYEKIPVKKKKRVHFNSFMLDVHLQMHLMKKEHSSADALVEVAKNISKDVELLCFDEFQITDIGDAMIVRRLFTSLYDNGLCMIATSNRAPDSLYEGGLNRIRFLPFIDLLKERCNVHQMSSSTDYRKEGTPIPDSTYFTPCTLENEKHIQKQIASITEKAVFKPSSVRVFGRDVPVRGAARGVAVFTFDDLCKSPLSTADYGAIAKNFHTVVMYGIPQMTMNERTEARRMIYLIDELYENKCKLFATAERHPDHLFSNAGAEGLGGVDLESADAFGVTDAGKNALFTGSDEVFAFGRAVSRMNEMQTKDYLLLPHAALGLSDALKAWVDTLEEPEA